MQDGSSREEKPRLLLAASDLQGISAENLLQEAGWEVFTAFGATSALELVQKLRLDLVLDYGLPSEQRGWLLKGLRQTPGFDDVPVLVVTQAVPTEIEQVLDWGATDFIVRPFSMHVLACRAFHLLRRARLTRNAADREIPDELIMLKKAVDSLPIGITLSDVHGRIVYTNSAEAEMHGTTVDALLGGSVLQFARQDAAGKPPWRHLDRLGAWRRESVNVRANGAEFPVQLTSIPVSAVDGRLLGMVTACEDISDRKLAEEKIYRLAYHDTLTRLPNRRLFLDRLQQALSFARRERHGVGLLFIDLDDFKEVNDAMGHQVGDQLLREVAGRLTTLCRNSETVARVGGDEFVVILSPLADPGSTTAVATRLQESFASPFTIGGRSIFCRASIGIATYPTDGEDLDSLIRCADTAMYQAKKDGKSCFRHFTAAMSEAIRERHVLEGALKQAVANRKFFLVFQPQWDLRTGRICGAEALVRWNHPELGLVPPSVFISLAEEAGVIWELGVWVLRSACKQVKRWRDWGHGIHPVAVNISGKQIEQPGFLELVQEVLLATGVKPDELELEFTETVLMEREGNIEILRSLKEMGVRLSIDDFGTGYSSLSYLKDFPVDSVKIDQSFVASLTTSDSGRTIVEAIVTMAHALNLQVVAEGVEEPAQLEFLTSLQCDKVQGFHLGQPMPAEELALVPSVLPDFRERSRRLTLSADLPENDSGADQPLPATSSGFPISGR